MKYGTQRVQAAFSVVDPGLMLAACLRMSHGVLNMGNHFPDSRGGAPPSRPHHVGRQKPARLVACGYTYQWFVDNARRPRHSCLPFYFFSSLFQERIVYKLRHIYTPKREREESRERGGLQWAIDYIVAIGRQRVGGGGVRRIRRVGTTGGHPTWLP